MSILALAALCWACDGDGDLPGNVGGGSEIEDSGGGGVGELEASQVVRVDDMPNDLALDDQGRLLITTQYGGYLMSYDLQSEELDVEARSVSGLQAVALEDDGTTWACTSDGGMEGTVGLLKDGEVDVIATQSDDGVLFRRPVDLVLTPEGDLLLADRSVDLLFLTDPSSGSTSALDVGITGPRALNFDGDLLYVASEEGVFTLTWPALVRDMPDSREAWGVLPYGDMVLAGNDAQKVFEVGGASLGGVEIERPGSLLAIEDTLYVSDLLGEYLWSLPVAGR